MGPGGATTSATMIARGLLCHTSGARYGRLCIWKRSAAVSTLAVLKQVPRSATTTATGEPPAPDSHRPAGRPVSVGYRVHTLSILPSCRNEPRCQQCTMFAGQAVVP